MNVQGIATTFCSSAGGSLTQLVCRVDVVGSAELKVPSGSDGVPRYFKRQVNDPVKRSTYLSTYETEYGRVPEPGQGRPSQPTLNVSPANSTFLNSTGERKVWSTECSRVYGVFTILISTRYLGTPDVSSTYRNHRITSSWDHRR
jgi:hypothetical protein